MSASDDLIAQLEPWETADLSTYANAIGGMLAEIERLSEDTDTLPGWGLLLDPDTCPYSWLPYLAMYVGERLPVGLSEARAREWVKDAPNRRRGTPLSIFQATQRHLTGNRLVLMTERAGTGGVAAEDQVNVVTYDSQTPSPAQTLADILSVFPADLILNYQHLVGQTWDAVWKNVAGQTYDTLVGALPGLQSYWKLDEASGNALDSGPANHPGTVGAATDRSQPGLLAGGQSAAAMGFGATGKNVVIGDFYDFAGTAPFSVTFWFKPNATIVLNSYFVWKRGGTGSNEGWGIGLDNTGLPFILRIVGGATAVAKVATAVAAGTTYMLAGTYDGTTLRIYLFSGGKLIQTVATADARSTIDHTAALTIGAQTNLTGGLLNAVIDNVAIRNVALTEAQLSSVAARGLQRRSWHEVRAAYASWGAASLDTVGDSVYSRPSPT